MSSAELNPDFPAADYGHVLELLYASPSDEGTRAVLSNNYNIILGALAIAARSASDTGVEGAANDVADGAVDGSIPLGALIIGKTDHAAITYARGMAAWAWCAPKTRSKILDPELAEAFARILLREVRATLSHPPHGAEPVGADEVALSASDLACYRYPNEGQQKERAAFIAGSVAALTPSASREGGLEEAALEARDLLQKLAVIVEDPQWSTMNARVAKALVDKALSALAKQGGAS